MLRLCRWFGSLFYDCFEWTCSLKFFREPRLPFSQATSERGDEFADRDVKVRIDAASVHVPARKSEPGAGGKTLHRAIVPPQNNLRRQRIISEARQGRDLPERKPAQGIVQT